MATSSHRLALPVGTIVGSYRVLRLLGQGGFGITYLAEHAQLGRLVAMKELLPIDFATRDDNNCVVPVSTDYADDFEWARQRFIEEARNVSRCSHRNVLKVHDVFEANGTAYMPTSYETGCTLSEWMNRLGRAPTYEEAMSILLPLLDGLEHVHQNGLLHRDIKPDNVWIRDDGSPVLLDFGAARELIGSRSRSMTALVSSGYTPLEQYSTEDAAHVGAATDLYAYAATAYRMLAGEKPPEATRRLSRSTGDPMVPLAQRAAGRYPDSMLAALDRCLSVMDQDRFQSVAELKAAMDLPASECVPEPDDTLTKKITKKPEPQTATAKKTSTATVPPSTPVAAKPASKLLHVILWPTLAVAAVAAFLFTRGKSGEAATAPTPAPASASTSTITQAPQTQPPANAPTLPTPTPAPVITPPPVAMTPAAPPPPPPEPELQLEDGKAGDVYKLKLPNGLEIPFCYCPAGSFSMGSPTTENGHDDDEKTVTVNFSTGFWIASNELTQEQWQSLMSQNPSSNQGKNLPVETINWNDAQSFVSKFARTVKLPARWTISLPTEAQWEYACRAGGSTTFASGSTLVSGQANFDGTRPYPAGSGGIGEFLGKTREVGSYSPNAWGLHDMHGNVWEWCTDHYDKALPGGENPKGSAAGDRRINRGGAWFTSANACRSAFRGASPPDFHSDGIGMRLALVRS